MSCRTTSAWLAAAAALLLPLAASAQAGAAGDQEPALLHAMFSDHAVLQRERPIHVYGTAAPGGAAGGRPPRGRARGAGGGPRRGGGRGRAARRGRRAWGGGRARPRACVAARDGGEGRRQ